MNWQNWLTYVAKFFGLDFVYSEFRTLVIWLGRFAWDKEKNEPSHRRGIALMCATVLCLGFLWVVGWSPWKAELREVMIEYAWVILTAGGLGVASVVMGSLKRKEPAAKEGDA